MSEMVFDLNSYYLLGKREQFAPPFFGFKFVKVFFVVEEDSALNYAESSSSCTCYEGSFFSSSSSQEGFDGVPMISGNGCSPMLRSAASLECFYLN